MRMRSLVLSVCLALGAAGTAAAQEPTPGLTIGLPGAVGLHLPLGDRLAVRPAFSFGIGGSDGDQTTLESDADIWSVGVSVTGLFYLQPPGAFRTYLAPRYAYAHSASTRVLVLPATIILPGDFGSETTSRDHSAAGLFGAEYRLAERFGIFAEVGVDYSHSTNRSESTGFSGLLSRVESTNWRLGSTAGVGVLIAF